METLYRNAASSDEKEVASSFTFSGDLIQNALKNIYSKKFHPMTDIEENMFDAAWKTLNMATDKGFGVRPADDRDRDFIREIKRNNAVFAAFKVHRAQNDMARLLLDKNGNLKPFEKWAEEVMPIADHQMIRWLRTEYDTAVIRAHRAADWRQFEREKDVLPNLEWMPSTSIQPGEDHRIFWGTIRPIDDPFWNMHRPGDRWNCKCGLKSTDKPVTDVAYKTTGQDKGHNGLENNPGKDGKLFSDKHPYVTEAYPGAKEAVDALEKRIDEMIAEMPDRLTFDEKMAIAKNNLRLEKALDITKGKPMTYEEANEGKENPNFNKSYDYQVNCQTCVPVHLLRRLGFDVEAAPNVNKSAYKLMDKGKIVWHKNLFINADGSDSEFTWAKTWAYKNNIKRLDEKDIKKFFMESMKEEGLYEIYCGWKKGGAHVFCAETKNGSIRLFDPQPGKDNVLDYISRMKGQSVGILRIDNKLVNPNAAGLFINRQ